MYKLPGSMILASVVATLGWCDWSAAQGIDSSMFYSQGVHDYFAGQCSRAEGYLTTALSIDPNDPRSYYFRALCLLRLGRTYEARDDLQIGAALEAQQPNRFAVGAALERVQGSDRLLIEQYRRNGKLAETNLRVERDRSRYEQIRAREPELLHRKATVPLDLLFGPTSSRPVVVFEQNAPPTPATVDASSRPIATAGAATSTGDPFADDQAGTNAPSNLMPVRPTTSTAKETPSSTSRPTTTQPAVGPGKAVPQPAAEDENPFGPMPAAAGTGTKSPPPAAETKPQPAAEEDPFRVF